jgi:predicted O-linked N-acetylglucosamine transferase (SPINDLY family)
MSKKKTKVPQRTPSKSAPTTAAVTAPITPPGTKPKVDFQHPMLEQARQLAREGKQKEAADVLETLAAQVPPFEKGQLLAHASTFTRVSDRKRAVDLAHLATQAQPNLPQAWLALTFALDEKQDRKGAIAAGLKVLETKASPRELVEVGRHLSRLGQDKPALEAVKRGFAESGEALDLASFTLRVALQCADWELANRITERFAKEHAEGRTRQAAETPRTHLLWCADEATNIKVITAFAEKSFAAHPPMVTAAWPGGAKRKLRIGYMSSDYRDHATSLLALGMMRHHDRERFEFYAYCTSYDDNSALRRDMLSRFDVARNFRNAGDKKAAEQIVADKIDVLVDLNGLTEGTRHGILAWHPAPVQISWLGFPGTCGGRFVEYIIGDDYTVPPGAEALFPEKVIRIPPTYQINDYAARWLPPPPRRQTTGLPEGVPVIGMFNNMNKVGSQVWQVWMQIMQEVPKAVLWMLDPGDVAREFLLRATTAAGVDVKRVIFAPKVKQEAHIARLQHCDLMLDPWPYGGHTTTGDSLFAERPVVALEGTNFASRVSGGLLHAAGLAHLVRPDIASYIQTAVTLLSQPEELAKLKLFIRQRKAKMRVFDVHMRTRKLEAAFLEVYRRSRQGLPAEHLHVRLKSAAEPDK